MMNFTFTLEKPDDGEWGVLKPDGNWTGQIKLLLDEKVDIGNKYFSSRYRGS